jgi:hypothetical protein
MLSILCCLILLCCGGGFGRHAGIRVGLFPAKWIAPIYGLMMRAWDFAAAFGPTMASVREATGRYEGARRWLGLATLLSAAVYSYRGLRTNGAFGRCMADPRDGDTSTMWFLRGAGLYRVRGFNACRRISWHRKVVRQGAGALAFEAWELASQWPEKRPKP